MKSKRYLGSNVSGVKLKSGILKQYQEVIKKTSIPYQWKILNDKINGAEKSGAIENFRIAAGE